MGKSQTVNEESRAKVVALAERIGFRTKLKANGTDIYVKVLMLKHPASSHAIYVHKDRGVTPAGRFDAYRLVVHPSDFLSGLDSGASGVSLPVNKRTGTNQFSSSNYAGYPSNGRSDEPTGRAYEARDLDSLEHLLTALHNHLD